LKSLSKVVSEKAYGEELEMEEDLSLGRRRMVEFF